MRKLVALAVAGLFVLAFSGPALADHPIWEGEPNYAFSVGGQFEIDGWYKDSYPAYPDDSTRFYNQETRIDFKGAWGDVTGRVRLEYDFDWDNGNQNKGDSNQLALDLSYITFPIPNTPVKIMAGLQGMAFGKSLFWDDAHYVLAAAMDFGGASLTLGTAKVDETYMDDDDSDVYTAIASAAAGGVDLAGLFFLQQTANDDDNPWTLGVAGSGSAGAIGYWFEGYFQGGEMSGLDRSGYAVAAGGKSSLGAADVGVLFAYGSGDGDGTDGDQEAFVPFSAYFDPQSIVIAEHNAYSIGNVWAIGVEATVKPMDAFSLTGKATFLNRVEEVVDGESYIGTELAAVGAYKINDYMKWSVKLNYLLAGDGLADGYDDNAMKLNNEFMVLF